MPGNHDDCQAQIDKMPGNILATILSLSFGVTSAHWLWAELADQLHNQRRAHSIEICSQVR